MTAINSVVDLTSEGAVAVITLNSPPVNALSQNLREGLYSALQRALEDGAVQAAVIICEGRTFVAGADIREFDSGRKPPGLRDMQAMFDGAPKPIVVAIHGTALGGGLELSLMSHYRVAVPSARVGLPEVHLGLLPGAGGTQALPRVVGAEVALDLITSGRQVGAAEAVRLGIVDALVEEGQLRASAIAFAKKIAGVRPIPRVRDRTGKTLADGKNPELFSRFRKLHALRFRGVQAPEAIIRCIEAAVNLPFEKGRNVEAELSAALKGPDSQSPAMRYAFFAERQASKIPDVPAETKTIPVDTVGIIGAGTMGGGIAMNFANAGIPVTIVEMKQEALDRGLSVIRKNYERTAQRGGMTQDDVEKRMKLISGSLDMNALKSVDLIIEAVFERMDIKKEVFAKLDAIAKPGAILATNTSGLNIDEIASATRRPQDVIGLHFFSPANVMKLLEVVRADHTSKEVIATSMALAKKIGKVAALVGVCPGFVGNRILRQRQQEAQKLVLEGAMPWDIDRVLYDFGFPMGPFAMSDLAGLDIGWTQEKSTSSTLREVLCEMDRRGQKTGSGYYDYDENRNPKPSPVTEKIIHDFMQKRGINARKISDEEILERCVYPMINEGVQILAEKKAIRASDIDVIWRYGYGFPVYRGGPMYYGDQIGPAKVLAKMKEFQATMGDPFRPSPLLEKAVAEGRKLAEL